jgi:hypothetical protein
MHVTGDKTHILVQVNTNFGLEVSEQEFLILDDDTEEIVMGVSWHRALMTEEYRGLIDIVDAEDDPRYSRRYFEVGQDEAREDRLMADNPPWKYSQSSLGKRGSSASSTGNSRIWTASSKSSVDTARSSSSRLIEKG